MITFVVVPLTRDLVALYQEHQTGLVRMAVLLVGDEATAEDVVQDVFLRMQDRPPRLDDEGKLLAYVRAAVLNGCRMTLRRRRVMWRYTEPHEPPIWSAESAVLLGEDRREVMRALRRLPRRQREALVLRYYLDLSDDEVSAAMGIRPGTVRSTMARALGALARELGEEAR
ncbi:SigE family RNA polymerase sigma factor [Actinomadura rubrisoli]|uniref:SigE family RNA polymerase sigma factor n=1 Tax=Actinomadura rubrisoli TaxID=2530368 RepID=A0A4R5BNS6_9ACTN|nr:SigE family RNA polymerase sigma factor [Actinomadura rubrisoli]TDD85632.1 SigE family RNA polymerase sigma factor [Actinomadura rubrisoli]